jgi:YVTN family beta-propeller protein
MKKLFSLCLLTLTLSIAAFAAPPGYHVLKSLPLGGEGGWDYLTVNAGRLYLSRGTHVMVVNVATESPGTPFSEFDWATSIVVGDIPDTPGVHGIAVAPELNRGFTSNGRANTSTIFNLQTLQVLGQVKTGSGPDCILYDPATQRVFTFNGESQDVTVFAAATGQVVATIPLGARPEFAATDGHGQVYVNLESTSQIAEIDAAAATVTRRIPLAPAEHPTGLAIDPAHHRLFSVCGSGVMAIVDIPTGQVTTVPIGARADAAAYDPGTGLSFSSNGDGTLTVVEETAPGKFAVVETVPTQLGARTMALAPQTHLIYLATAQFGPPPAPTADRPHPWPTPVKGSFVILVVGT